ncbi:extracellular solute-binding protein [Actinomadura graeca]|uniref:extracellular solute-binding protein n=1 Tax=Actinomadura graeca TaxID=2750812 RepID=UPI001E5C1DE7|nr:extracellular solute-binding protein [Actinomadura graeca]
MVGRRLHAALRGAATPLALGVLSACGCGGSTDEAPVTLRLAAYSTPRGAYEKIISEYQKRVKVRFETSYGASGDQSAAVESGERRADIVAFSLEPDITRLVRARLVPEDWRSDAYGGHGGMVTNSVVVIATRKGNPRKLHTWRDLLRPGIEVITPNAFVSGGARWNVLAGYGAESDRGKDKAAGRAYLRALFAHVPVQDSSARGALQTFNSGWGDALLAYENEVSGLAAPLETQMPEATILIENPVAVTLDSEHPREAKAFLTFLRTPAAQRIFAENGYRPVLPGIADPRRFPVPRRLFTIKDLGGWEKLDGEFFDPERGLVADIQERS